MLKAIPGTELNEYVINLLRSHEITTVLQFVTEDTSKLTKFTNISKAEIDFLKAKLIDIFGPKEVCAANIFNIKNSFPVFSTGIQSLDDILGGFSEGNIIEICGLPGVGKSLLCSTFCINYAKNYQFETIYLDTKNDFSGIRIYKILSELNYSKDEIGKIMQKIKVERIYEPQDLNKILKDLYEYLKKPNSIKLLIIDSIPAISLQFHDDEGFVGKSWLTKISILLKRLANDHKLIVIVINIVTRWSEDLDEIDSIKSQTTVKPSLGKYWETVPTIRLRLDELSVTSSNLLSNNCLNNTNITTNSRNKQRKLKIIRSNYCKNGISCIVNASNCGII